MMAKFKLFKFSKGAVTLTPQIKADIEKHFNESVPNDDMQIMIRAHINVVMMLLGYRFVERGD